MLLEYCLLKMKLVLIGFFYQLDVNKGIFGYERKNGAFPKPKEKNLIKIMQKKNENKFRQNGESLPLRWARMRVHVLHLGLRSPQTFAATAAHF